MKDIRLLKASEIECRIGTISEKGCSLLLYKDARVDMRLLDEIYGQMNWKRSHEIIDGNLYCTISVWDSDKKEWVSKQDVGTESMTEKEKGQASDSFKRAGFNWGIGRELYTSPFIWINPLDKEFFQKNGKFATYTKFSVSEIGYNESREINKLVIIDNKGNTRFTLGSKISEPKKEEDSIYTIALKDIENANNVDSLKAVWNEYPSLHNDKKFIAIVNAKKKALEVGL